MNKKIFAVAIIVLLFACGSFSYLILRNKNNSIKGKTSKPKGTLSVSKSNNCFAFNLFQSLIKDEDIEENNILISPISISLALQMTYNGASGNTKKEMEKVLQLQSLSKEQINQYSSNLVKTLQRKTGDIELTIANSLWGNNKLKFKEEFLKLNNQYFSANIRYIDVFDPPGSSQKINKWVEKKTYKKIKNLIKEDDITPSLAIILVNSIYFKDKWVSPFTSTLEEPFYTATGKVSCQMMTQLQDRYNYYENNLFQALKVPYENGSSLVAILPKKDSGLNELFNYLNSDNWLKWSSSFQNRPILLKMPKFKYEFVKELKEQLINLGMKSVFDSTKSNFSDIAYSDLPIFITFVRHKTYIDLNEAGTEAAGATAVGTKIGMSPNTLEPIKVMFDRPFFYAITDDKTGAILFMGTVANPNLK